MFKGRSGCWTIIAVAAVLVLILFLVSRCQGLQLPFGQPTGLPVDLQEIIPTSWQVIQDQYKLCDFDNDGETEWMIVYKYDAAAGTGDSLIGGVVYDAQVNRVPQAPSDRSPYRSALLIPYKLLPDIYTDKGQGYLGETSVAVSLYPAQTGNECRGSEIIVQGYSGSGHPTRLSIFRWKDASVGYQGAHFVGNARVVASSPTGPITEVTTYNRLNDRSAVCDVQYYSRSPATTKDGLPPEVQFTRQDTAQTIDFCFGPPNDPAYPDGVVVALLRGNSPKDQENNPSPTGATYLTLNAVLPPELTGISGANRTVYRILSFTNRGTLASQPAQGYLCNPTQVAQVTSGDQVVWWCGRETAEILTEIKLEDGSPARVLWKLISIASDELNADVHWRIERADWG
jgi:hypothetical protein